MCSGEYVMRYLKSVSLSGSPYSVSHACPTWAAHFLLLPEDTGLLVAQCLKGSLRFDSSVKHRAAVVRL